MERRISIYVWTACQLQPVGAVKVDVFDGKLGGDHPSD